MLPDWETNGGEIILISKERGKILRRQKMHIIANTVGGTETKKNIRQTLTRYGNAPRYKMRRTHRDCPHCGYYW